MFQAFVTRPRQHTIPTTTDGCAQRRPHAPSEPPIPRAVLVILELHRLNRDGQAIPQESAATRPSNSRGDACGKMSPESAGCWASDGEARQARAAWALLCAPLRLRRVSTIAME